MSLLDTFNLCKQYITEYGEVTIAAIVILFTIVQIAPIKINPWSYVGKVISKLLSKLGKLLLADFISQIEELKDKVNLLSNVIDENEIDRIRWEIFSFSNSCQRDENHTQNDFQHIFKINKKYHNILKRIDGENGEIDREIAYLEELYMQKKRDNSFLMQ